MATSLWTAVFVSLVCSWRVVLGQERGWLIVADTKEQARELTQVIVRGPDGEPSDVELAWWSDWKKYYNKSYACGEELKARTNFLNNMRDVQEVNYDMTKSWWASGNKWSDMDYNTFKTVVLMDPVELAFSFQELTGRRMLEERGLQDTTAQPARRRLLANSWDWRDKGKMTPVKNQGGCGSCWSFAATTNLEAAYLISQDLDVSDLPGFRLSTQQLIDCSRKKYNSNGCNGGSADGAFNYAKDNALGLAADYPDEYKQGACDAKARSGRVIQLSQGAVFGPRKDEQALMELLTRIPVTTYIAVGADFQNYRGGVYASRNAPDTVNHAVVLVGYVWNGQSSNSHFVLQNSWSPDWGEGGYMRIQMDGDGNGLCKMYTWITHPPLYSFTKTLGGLKPKSSPPEPSKPSKPKAPAAPKAPKAPASPDKPSEPDAPRRRAPRPPHGPYRPRSQAQAAKPPPTKAKPCKDKSGKTG